MKKLHSRHKQIAWITPILLLIICSIFTISCGERQHVTFVNTDSNAATTFEDEVINTHNSSSDSGIIPTSAEKNNSINDSTMDTTPPYTEEITETNSALNLTISRPTADKSSGNYNNDAASSITQKNICENDSFIYNNQELEFSLILPKSWKYKCVIDEAATEPFFSNPSETQIKGVVFSYKSDLGEARNGWLFMIFKLDEKSWDEEIAHNLPVEKLFEKDGVIYYVLLTMQIPFDPENANEKKSVEEYEKMLHEMDEILDSFQVISSQ